MRRRTPMNLILAVAVIGLAALLWFGREPTKVTPPITKLKRKDIHQVELRFADAPSIKLVKTKGMWRLTAPVKARAEATEVDRIMNLAQAKPVRSYAAKDIKPADVGLDKPQQTVVFNNKIRIALGDSDALQDKRYAKVGNKVYLVTSPGKQAIDPDYSNLVARRLVPKGIKISQIELPGYKLTRNGKAGWDVSPEAKDKGADAAQNTVNTWKHARALWIKPAKPDQKSQGSVRVHTVDGTTRTFDVIARKPQLILSRPDLKVNYHVARNQAAPMLDMVIPKAAKSPKAQKAISAAKAAMQNMPVNKDAVHNDSH